ncbi:MAG: excinuclease ABC subunit UvrC [Bryobacteraceae bacterium]
MSRIDELREKAAGLPQAPGVYIYRGADGEVLYVGKAKNLRARVRSYFSAERLAEAKTGRLIHEAAGLEYILVDNEKEALALENQLIKQHRPRFNVLLRDDKTYPYIKLTHEKWPRVYVTRRIRKDGQYFGPYFPGNLAHRLVKFIHRNFQIPSCRVDLAKAHASPCLEYHIHRCLGPCVPGLASEEAYAERVRDVRAFLEGRTRELAASLRARMEEASEALEFERAAALRDLLRTVEELEERQKMAAASGDDADYFALHAEPPHVAVNIFHVRNGRVVDRRELFWEDVYEYDEQEFLPALLMQIYGEGQPVPAQIHLPVELEDREILEELLAETRGRKVTIHTPQRGTRKALLELVATNARQSFEQRFRVRKPRAEEIAEALEEALDLPEAPRRIECFDISHIQGVEKVASMVVWENGRMKKSDYRRFIIRTVEGSDDFASMREAVGRRYRRVLEEGGPMPALVLVDGGLGQLRAAAAALEEVGVLNQPLAAIAKREEILYVYGREDEPVMLDRASPVLHLIQMIRDEAHRFAVTFHRQRRDARTLKSELLEIPGIGPKTVEKLLKELGSLAAVRAASEEELARVAGRAAARRIRQALGLTVDSAPKGEAQGEPLRKA